MRIFFDSSAFAKRFIEESGSNDIEHICGRASSLGLSIICVPEVISAFNRRQRENTLNRIQYQQAKRHLLEDVRDADIINLTVPVIGSSIRILENGNIRAMDALHVACAIDWNADLFVSADKRQLTAAKKEGLKTKKV